MFETLSSTSIVREIIWTTYFIFVQWPDDIYHELPERVFYKFNSDMEKLGRARKQNEPLH